MFAVFLMMDVEYNCIYFTLYITLLCQQSGTIKILAVSMAYSVYKYNTCCSIIT